MKLSVWILFRPFFLSFSDLIVFTVDFPLIFCTFWCLEGPGGWVWGGFDDFSVFLLHNCPLHKLLLNKFRQPIEREDFVLLVGSWRPCARSFLEDPAPCVHSRMCSHCTSRVELNMVVCDWGRRSSADGMQWKCRFVRSAIIRACVTWTKPTEHKFLLAGNNDDPSRTMSLLRMI